LKKGINEKDTLNTKAQAYHNKNVNKTTIVVVALHVKPKQKHWFVCHLYAFFLVRLGFGKYAPT
jgi:hypothetical protein